MRLFELAEAPYRGNIGIHEMMEFYKLATPAEKKELDDLILSNRTNEAWDLIQQVTGMKLNTDDLVTETLKKVNGKWALVSKSNPKKVLQYYKGSGKPSKEWVSKVERRVHSFEEVQHENGTYSSLQVSASSAKKIIAWCEENNVTVSNPDELHCTIVFSKTPVPEVIKLDGKEITVTGKVKEWEVLGEDCLVLMLDCPGASYLHKEITDLGATSDYDEYIAHVTITTHYETNEVPGVIPDFDIEFDSIQVNELDDDWNDK